MIRPLRRVHRLVAAGLFIALPTLLAVLLPLGAAPPRPPRAAALSKPLPSGFVLGTPLQCCNPVAEVAAPDRALPEVLVYWSAPGATRVDARAQILGTLTTAPDYFRVPGGGKDGSLLLYSPALGTVLERRDVHEGVAR